MTQNSWQLGGPEEKTIIVNNEDQLEQELNRLHEEANKQGKSILVTLGSPSGKSLSIGLGSDMSVLSWINEKDTAPYKLSKGSLADDDEGVSFLFSNQESEF